MPMYRVVTPLRNGGPKPVAPGESVELTRKEGDALVAIGAVEPVAAKAAPAPVAPSAPPAPKPLAKMSKPELQAIVAAEQVDVPADATNLQLVAAIEAKRKAGGQ